ncbi:DOPA 4,5-dioxygenase family protein [Vibrio coralliilyticus]|uniref:DOPA 4,5-dioxygenase family protein n=1 Tax=Vibrio coralliilyticus TaxID=190893 RepID=UPI000B1C74FB|nr:DOPA 4,5-dioxygenase family protein [Vibrio coralliilyticus]
MHYLDEYKADNISASKDKVANIGRLKGWHAHIYFDEHTEQKARKVIDKIASEITELKQGRFHRELVGPHLCWSCQLYFKPKQLGEVASWLALNRKGLTVLFHPITGNEFVDHTDHAFWMGNSKKLNLENL